MRDERVRILVVPSDYKLTNMGDAAMLKVVVAAGYRMERGPATIRRD